MALVRPARVGEVRGLTGTVFRADIELDPGRSLDWYEIQLAPRAGPDDPVWDHPIWRFRSDMPHIATIDGTPPFEGMRVRSALPTFRLRAAQPVDRVRWELRQDGGVVDKGGGAEGISRDGRSVKFTPGKRLRRSGELAKPRGDVLYPPFDSHLADVPRSPESRIRYTASTNPFHAGQEDRFAVDFNFGSGIANLGEWVLAAAGGKVIEIRQDNGQVHILHDQFEPPIETVYAHMQPIHPEVRLQGHVDPLQRLGRIGAEFHGEGSISPHLHHQHRVNGQGVKMRLLLGDEVTEIPVSKPAPTVFEEWEERKVSGWDRPRGLARARLVAKVRRASDGRWSAANRLRFVVAPRGADVPAAPVAALGPVDTPVESDIAYGFDGPDVEPGKYSLRYRIQDGSGAQSDWAHDDSVVVRPQFA